MKPSELPETLTDVNNHTYVLVDRGTGDTNQPGLNTLPTYTNAAGNLFTPCLAWLKGNVDIPTMDPVAVPETEIPAEGESENL